MWRVCAFLLPHAELDSLDCQVRAGIGDPWGLLACHLAEVRARTLKSEQALPTVRPAPNSQSGDLRTLVSCCPATCCLSVGARRSEFSKRPARCLALRASFVPVVCPRGLIHGSAVLLFANLFRRHLSPSDRRPIRSQRRLWQKEKTGRPAWRSRELAPWPRIRPGWISPGRQVAGCPCKVLFSWRV